jgi:hypothetical protein
MPTRLLMAAASLFMLLLGAAATFAPQELLAWLAIPGSPLHVQVTGALYLGFAMLDWMAKDSALGGIYGRPIVIGNLLHFTAAALALAKGGAVVFAIVYGVFAVGFGWAMMTTPKR